ncbi:glycosyltransferase family 15 protein [Fistulina hepatica ATCC 64428]|nr:glycosyltransferase family 15 protein [Fistulina hepatica ATCC 64428]
MAAIVPVMTPRRYILLVLLLVVCLHYILSISFESYGSIASLSNLGGHLEVPSGSLSTEQDFVGAAPATHSTTLPNLSYNTSHGYERANATFVFLCRNSDLEGVVSSIQQVEDRFNKKFHYPWVLLNEEPFTDEFKMRVSVLTSGPISFGLIPREHWVQPDWIDENRARKGRLSMMAQRIIYGGDYRNMCRFNSGFFFRHELLQQYKYYWRVEPDVKFFCDVDYDVFKYMEENGKIYGFVISLYEWEPTIPSLWSTVKEFIEEHPEYVSPQNSMDFLSDNGGENYNLCHYWSNFEIADMDFWRGEQYQAFFNYLEAKGGFYYERWGDAPIHSMAASLFARKDQVHFFRDIGYRHEQIQRCPVGELWGAGRCACNPSDSFDYHDNSCIRRFESLFA